MKRRKYQLKSNAGPHYHNDGKCYEKGDVVLLTMQEAESFLFKLNPLFKDEPEPEPEPHVNFRIEGVEGGYNVVNEVSGQCVNDKPLKLKQAQIIAGPNAEVIHREEMVDPAPLTAKHKGGGKYNIVWEETGNRLTEDLYTRAEVSEILKKIKNGTMTINDLVD